MWYLTLSLFLISFFCILCFSIYFRYSNGVSTSELAQSRFYEIVPVRALFWLFLGLLCECCLLFLYLLFLHAQKLYNQNLLLTLPALSVLPYFVLIVVSAICGWLFWKHVIIVPEQIVSKVNICTANSNAEIRTDYLYSLGTERFPNHIDPEGKANHIIRWVIVSGSILIIGLLIYADYTGLITEKSEIQRWSNYQKEIALFFLWPSCMLFALLIFNNQDYAFLPFRQTLIGQGVLVGLIIMSLFVLNSNNAYTVVGIGLCLSFCALRTAYDLLVFYQYKRMKQVTDPIAADLRRSMPYLPQVSKHLDFKLPELNMAALSQRIAQGCINLEKRSVFVLRNPMRFMKDVEVKTQNFTVAMLRYLTVDRGILLSGGTGTYESYRYPQVPIWNLQLFPLHPPVSTKDDGFRNMDDSLTLSDKWDVIQACGGCGGSGWVWETETYYETENYTEYYTDLDGRSQSRQESRLVMKHRQVRRTCSNCSGSGRTRHQQILNTKWRYLISEITDPEIPIPELVENAEEKQYFRLPLTVEFKPALFRPETFGFRGQLINQMNETGRELVTLHAKHVQFVLSLKGGQLYKADFQICGFRAIHVVFKELGGYRGWLFGERPDFYFPRLPLCYATVGTLLFMPPLVIALGTWVQWIIFRFLLK